LQKAQDDRSQIESSMNEKQSAIDGLEARLHDKDVEYMQLEERLRQKESDENSGNEERQTLQNELSSLTSAKQACLLLF